MLLVDQMPKIMQASEVPSDSEEEETVEVPQKTQKKALSEAKLKALELARVKAAQKAKQRSAVTKAAKEAERAKKMADKVNAFALQQKARAIESGLIHEAPAAIPAPPPEPAPAPYDDIRTELRALRELLTKPEAPAAPSAEKPKKQRTTAVKPKLKQRPVEQAPVPVQPPTRVDTLKAMLGR